MPEAARLRNLAWGLGLAGRRLGSPLDEFLVDQPMHLGSVGVARQRNHRGQSGGTGDLMVICALNERAMTASRLGRRLVEQPRFHKTFTH